MRFWYMGPACDHTSMPLYTPKTSENACLKKDFSEVWCITHLNSKGFLILILQNKTQSSTSLFISSR